MDKQKAIVILALILLSGCGGHVTPEQYEKAVKTCESHGGLAVFWTNTPLWMGDAHCNDGVAISDWLSVEEDSHE